MILEEKSISPTAKFQLDMINICFYLGAFLFSISEAVRVVIQVDCTNKGIFFNIYFQKHLAIIFNYEKDEMHEKRKHEEKHEYLCD